MASVIYSEPLVCVPLNAKNTELPLHRDECWQMVSMVMEWGTPFTKSPDASNNDRNVFILSMVTRGGG